MGKLHASRIHLAGCQFGCRFSRDLSQEMHCVRLMIVAIYMAHVDHMSKLGVHASSVNFHQIRWFVSFKFLLKCSSLCHCWTKLVQQMRGIQMHIHCCASTGSSFLEHALLHSACHATHSYTQVCSTDPAHPDTHRFGCCWASAAFSVYKQELYGKAPDVSGVHTCQTRLPSNW